MNGILQCVYLCSLRQQHMTTRSPWDTLELTAGRPISDSVESKTTKARRRRRDPPHQERHKAKQSLLCMTVFTSCAESKESRERRHKKQSLPQRRTDQEMRMFSVRKMERPSLARSPRFLKMNDIRAHTTSFCPTTLIFDSFLSHSVYFVKADVLCCATYHLYVQLCVIVIIQNSFTSSDRDCCHHTFLRDE